ncbi:hypothetical protein RHSIM_Rhsim01G0078400 [Rhododendron simsii]|uniref:Uncharacterized protein n=1 Tax=Rhododendron simsii TaxID=118357 RepID=A0A834HGC8_RHOSS|nr:hypothetical protein RHSIM_Rhsim01G0078400 [Rhododendron simsii]
MYRTTSTPRFSDEFLVNQLPPGKGSPTLKGSPSLISLLDTDDLPVHELISDADKKEIPRPHKSSGENAVHLIPLVLILCALILWLFSKQPETIFCNISNTAPLVAVLFLDEVAANLLILVKCNPTYEEQIKK